jgi:hypothetical protein
MANGKTPAEKLDAYMAKVKEDLLNEMRIEVIRRQMKEILDKLAVQYPLRQHLAIRMYWSYARNGLPGRRGTIAQNWVWSKEQSDQYMRTAEFKEALNEIKQVNTNFKSLNTSFGRNEEYYLHATTEPRSWSKQSGNWLESPVNKKAYGAKKLEDGGQYLNNLLLKEIAKPAYADDPTDAESLKQFKKFLASRDSKPIPQPSYATPGLSQHGRSKAFDFVVHSSDGKEVVGTSTGQIAKWKDGRWAEQLNKAIKMTSASFEGPLTVPEEPWHYYYNPAGQGG